MRKNSNVNAFSAHKKKLFQQISRSKSIQNMKNGILATPAGKNLRAACFPRNDWPLYSWSRDLAEWLSEIKNSELQDGSFTSNKHGLSQFFAVKCKAMEYA